MEEGGRRRSGRHGCGLADGVLWINEDKGGGDTTCGEYLTMSSDDQYEAVKDLLSEKGKTPSKAMIQLSVSSAKLFCVTAGDDQSKIREING